MYIFLAAFLCGMMRMRLGAFSCPPFLYPLEDLLYRVRGRLLENTARLFGKHAPLLQAMLWGEQSALREEALAPFRRSGLAHILALSGLHVSFFAGALLLLLPAGKARLRFYACAAFLLLYCAIAAFPASLVRASIMTLCMLAAPLFRRRSDQPCSLALSAFIILLWDPKAFFSISFQLSFLAAAGIAMLRAPFVRLFSLFPRVAAESLAVSAAASCATLPLSMRYFKTLPLYSLVLNFFLVPLVPFCIFPAFIAVLLCFVSPVLAQAPAFIAYHMTEVLNALTTRAATLPHACIVLEKAPGLFFLLPAWLCMFVLSPYFLAKPPQKRSCALVLVFVMCGALFYDILQL